MDAPWDEVAQLQIESADTTRLKRALLETFKISQSKRQPELEVSLKPFILLFDEYYTDLFRMNEAERWMMEADKMVFIGTSFSVNITSIALRMGLQNGARIEIVDPEPTHVLHSNVSYKKMTALEYIQQQG